ncbi:MAG: ABC transporter permease [Bdellovibrionales bacterium]|nr:ABC transporter permease [Bdellovibrionales bacterium]
MLFKKYLFSQRSGALIKVISWISIISVTLGISSLIVVTSVMNGFNHTIRKRMFGIEPHLVVSQSSDEKDSAETFLKLKTEVLKDYGGQLESVAYVESQDVIIRTFEGLFGGGVAKGYDPEELNDLLKRIYHFNLKPKEQKSDLVEQYQPVELGKLEVAIGMDLARELEVFEGDQVLLIPPETLLLPPGEAPPYQRVTVKEILSTRLSDFDSNTILFNRKIGLPFLQKSLSKKPELSVRFDQADVALTVKNDLLFEGFEANSWRDRNKVLFFALKLEKIAMTTFLAMAVAITGFSILSVLALLIAQKQFDYALFLAMGYSQKNCQALFARIGLILAVLGVVVGGVLGTSIALYLEAFPLDILPAIY